MSIYPKVRLGLCHSPPRLENQRGSWKKEKNLHEEKNSMIEPASGKKPVFRKRSGLICDMMCVQYLYI